MLPSSLQDETYVTPEGDVVVLGPHFAAALPAREIGVDGLDMPGSMRECEYQMTFDRDVAAARTLMSRLG